MPVGSPPQPILYSPSTLVKHHSPPIAAYLRTPNHPPGLDLSRPLLLYSHYVSTKVRATSLQLHRDSSLSRIGPSLVIPDCYSGWFTVISPEGKSAPIYSSIEEVYTAKLSFFLTRYDVNAFSTEEDGESGKVLCRKIIVLSGHVLKFVGILQGEDLDKKRHKNGGSNSTFGTSCRSNSSSSSSSNSATQQGKFAQCLNFKNETVYIPLKTKGRFYATAQKSSKSLSKVFLIRQLIKNFKFPLTVKLVCGQVPRVPCSFTGLLRLEKSYNEDVILACTMTSEAYATLFEIEVDSNFLLRPILDPLFGKSPIFLKTVSYCQDEADIWQRQIKVTHHVTEKRSRSLSRSLSDKFVDPLGSTRSLNLPFLSEFNVRKTSTKESFIKQRFWGTLNDKENRRKTDKKSRQLSKQNTYVFQTIRKQISLPIEKESTSKLHCRLSQSVDDLESSKYQYEVCPIPENEDFIEEDHYTVIGEPPSKKEKWLSNESVSKKAETLDEFIEKDDAVQEKSTDTPEPAKQDNESLPIANVSNKSNITEVETVSVISIQSEMHEENDKNADISRVSETMITINDNEEEKICSTSKDNGIGRFCFQDNKEDVMEQQNNRSDEEIDKMKENKSRILMRGNTVVIRVKNKEDGLESPLLQQCAITSSHKNEKQKLNILENQKDIEEISNSGGSIDLEIINESPSKISCNYENEVTLLTNSVSSDNDLIKKETNSTETTVLSDNISNELNDTLPPNKEDEERKLLSLKEDTNCLLINRTKETSENSNPLTETVLNNINSLCNEEVALKTPDAYPSLENKTYFCITTDIPENHIFHTIDLKHLKTDLIHEICKNNTNPIIIIKNDGNVKFNTTAENVNVFGSGGDFGHQNESEIKPINDDTTQAKQMEDPELIATCDQTKL